MMVRRIGFGALLGTAVGVTALILGAIRNWTVLLSGGKLSLRVLGREDFGPAGEFYKSVGALSVLLAVLAVLALLDRTGWLSRLVGLAAIAVSVLFAIQAYRHFGHSAYDSVHGVRPGFWFELIAGLALFTTAGARRTRRAHRARAGADIDADTKIDRKAGREADSDRSGAAARGDSDLDTGVRAGVGAREDDGLRTDTSGVRIGSAADSEAADSRAAEAEAAESMAADSSRDVGEEADSDTLVRPRS